MIRGKVLLAVGLVLVLSLVLSGCSKVGDIQPQFVSEVEMIRGDKVHLFYGGTQKAQDIFCSGETVSVYRTNPQEHPRYIEVGKVRILRPVDDHYLDGIVVEGKVKVGDLARKGIAACMVVPHIPGGKRGEE